MIKGRGIVPRHHYPLNSPREVEGRMPKNKNKPKTHQQARKGRDEHRGCCADNAVVDSGSDKGMSSKTSLLPHRRSEGPPA